MSEEIGNTNTTNVKSVYRRAAQHVKEQSQRTRPLEFLKRMWDGRGQDYPFSLKPGTKEVVLFLDDITTYRVHRFIYGVDTYAKKEFIQCRSQAISDTADSGIAHTGEVCLMCMAFGEPFTIAVAPVATFHKFTRKDGTNSSAQARILIASQDSTINSLVDMACSEMSGGSLKYLAVSVSRGKDKNTTRVGDSFVIQSSYRDKKKLANLKGIREVVAGLKKIDMDKLFGPVDQEEMLRALQKHKDLCDSNPSIIKNGYNSDAMARALRGDSTSDDALDDILTGDTPEENMFDLLDDISAGGSSSEDTPEKKESIEDVTEESESPEEEAEDEDFWADI